MEKGYSGKNKSEENRSGQHKWLIIALTVMISIVAISVLIRHMNYGINDAAVGNLTGSLSTVSITADGLMKEDAEALRLIAEKAITKEDLNAWMNDFCATNGMTGILLTKPGENVKIAGSGTEIPLENLDFSEKREVDGLPMAASYVNSDGDWAYALCCPVMDGKDYIADVIAEYAWDHIYQSMPNNLYDDDSSLLIADQLSGKIVVQPDESVETTGGLTDVEDFLEFTQTGDEAQNFANMMNQGLAQITEKTIYGKSQFVYVWPVNEGTTYLMGMVPMNVIVNEIPIVRYSVFWVGGIVLICCFCIGITFGIFNYKEKKELKMLDEERKKYNQELQKALDKAKKANAAKTIFLSNMSHDMRTPLNGITGLLKIEESHPNDLKLIQENREKMKVSAEYLLSLVNDLLQMSKLEEGNLVLKREPMDIRKLPIDIITLIGERAAERNISFTYEQDQEEVIAPYVYTSPMHIRQLLLNIYGNCIKYNKPGGTIHTCFKCLQRTEHECVYQWTISDTGIGMSEEFQQHIFEPFTQEHNDARSVYSGAGLGMAIVKKIVDAMQGKIEVKSKIGEGTSFQITLPFEIAEEKDVLAEQEPKKQEKEYSIQGLHLLMAEDNALNAEIAEMLLGDKGAVITTVEDGRKALNTFLENPAGTFDGILMDVMMPVMDGLTATRAIRGLDREDAKSIPIIAMTANAFEEDEKQCLEAGMTAYLAKPLQIEKAVEVIAKCCEK